MTTTDALTKFNANGYQPGRKLRTGTDGLTLATKGTTDNGRPKLVLTQSMPAIFGKAKTTYRVIVRTDCGRGYNFHSL